MHNWTNLYQNWKKIISVIIGDTTLLITSIENKL